MWAAQYELMLCTHNAHKETYRLITRIGNLTTSYSVLIMCTNNSIETYVHRIHKTYKQSNTFTHRVHGIYQQPIDSYSLRSCIRQMSNTTDIPPLSSKDYEDPTAPVCPSSIKMCSRSLLHTYTLKIYSIPQDR